ncbi:hypothetical protein GCM10011581_24930 [Saccharopolyspora subtropica]|uniref:ESX-1 secretion-associated protein n=1 Tax=Saccharopolyspora thermophila TaxID=89367 RepID=A0A917JXF3_9PSEU|nr:type VII secretion target [Saccharopolyspora subtropica]GGI86829.1 hypothetical protein GCM10011581_24930 [Saccharopolyspora subtropica]
MSSLQVDPGQIRAHAGTLTQLADGLSSTAAGLRGGMGDNALGTFVQFLTAALGSAMTQTAEAITHASSAVDAVGAALVRTAEDYEHVDEHNAELLGGEATP